MEAALRTPCSSTVMPGMNRRQYVFCMKSPSISLPRPIETRSKRPVRCRAVDVQDSVLPQQQGTKGDEDVAVPPPSNMQAQVMLVPKKNASAALLRQNPTSEDPVGKFLLKCKLAWNLFFPPQDEPATVSTTPKLSPKDLGKQRLQMILVADRCGLSPSSLVEMKKNTLAALADCMDLEDLQDAHLRFTMTREGGTTYSMAVPILRPGPYSEDGSVVGQGAVRNAAGSAYAAVAAAAATAGGWDQADDQSYEEGIAGDDSLYHEDHQQSMSPVLDVIVTDEDGSEAIVMQQIEADPVRSVASSPSAYNSAAHAETSDGLEHDSGNDSDGDFKQQLRSLLVEELVHDVEELVQHNAEDSVTAAATAGESNTDVAHVDSSPPSSSSSSPIMGMSASELREVAAKEVERMGDKVQDSEAL